MWSAMHRGLVDGKEVKENKEGKEERFLER